MDKRKRAGIEKGILKKCKGVRVMRYNKIKLYHYSDINIPSKIKVKYFGKNHYTLNDVKSCNIKRAFFFLDNYNHEPSFLSNDYTYIVEVNKNRLYDLRKDKDNLYLGFSNIFELVKYVKKHYIGIIYNIGNWDIANIFYDISYTKKVKRG